MKSLIPNKPVRSGSHRACQRYLILLFLLPMVITRVMVPPGYMPAPIHSVTSITMFMLCGGDSQSAQLIKAWEHTHTSEHASHGHPEIHGFELCEFDALSFTLADLSATDFTPVIGAAEAHTPLVSAAAVLRLISRNHPVRAPPPFRYT